MQRDWMTYDTCVTHWIINKRDRKNEMMLKENDILNVINSETNYYSMLTSYLQMWCLLFLQQSCIRAWLDHSRLSLQRDLLIRLTFRACFAHNLCSTLDFVSLTGIRPTVSLEALSPQHFALPSAAESKPGRQAEPLFVLDPTTTPNREVASRQAHSGSYTRF